MMDLAARRDEPLFFSAVAAGILFFAVSTVEIFARPGFDIYCHAISMLSLGERGWVMVATFIISGLLVLACAARMRSAAVGTAGPALIGLYGIGLVIAGIFPAPAGLGFPPGTPEDQTPVMTASAVMHSVGFMVAFSALILSCFVFARQLWHHNWLAGLSLVVGFALPILIGLGMAGIVLTGIAFYAAAMLGWLWLGLLALELARGRGNSRLRAGPA